LFIDQKLIATFHIS